MVHSAYLLSHRTYFHEEEVSFVLYILLSIKQYVCLRFHTLQERVSRWIKPPTTFLVLGTFVDLTRSKAKLLAENALLRQQLIILHRQMKRPVYQKTDRVLLVFLARMVRNWKQARSVSYSQRHFCVGIVSSSVCSGSTHRKPARASRGSHTRQSR